jgi:hypothetical protein
MLDGNDHAQVEQAIQRAQEWQAYIQQQQQQQSQ